MWMNNELNWDFFFFLALRRLAVVVVAAVIVSFVSSRCNAFDWWFAVEVAQDRDRIHQSSHKHSHKCVWDDRPSWRCPKTRICWLAVFNSFSSISFSSFLSHSNCLLFSCSVVILCCCFFFVPLFTLLYQNEEYTLKNVFRSVSPRSVAPWHCVYLLSVMCRCCCSFYFILSVHSSNEFAQFDVRALLCVVLLICQRMYLC